MVSLPSWATHLTDTPLTVISVDPDKAYPALMRDLGVETGDLDRYWIEVLRTFVKLSLQVALGRFNFGIRIQGSGDYRGRWAHASHRPGRWAEFEAKHGAALAERFVQLSAKDHFKRLRGVLPAG